MRIIRGIPHFLRLSCAGRTSRAAEGGAALCATLCVGTAWRREITQNADPQI